MSQPRPSAGAKLLTSGKSGIVTSSRSLGRPLLLLLKKLATELQLSCDSHQGAQHNNKEAKHSLNVKTSENFKSTN